MKKQTNLPILYTFRRCPYAMRARMALFKSGLKFELREIILKNKPASMLDASPKGTVPVLILNNGEIIEESIDIMHHALSQNEPDNWLGGEDTALIKQNDGLFKHNLDRYKYPNRYPDEDCTNARSNGENILKSLDQRLSHHKNLTGDKTSITDIAIFPFIRQFANVDRDWFTAQPLPHLQKWLTTHLDSPLFQTIMHKYTPWEEKDTPVIIQDDAPE